ncbi:type III secretion system inner rod subunit SctI, partial [Pseudomonas sp. GW456-L12]
PMEIEAVRMAALHVPKDSAPSPPTPTDIAAFNQALFGQVDSPAEISALSQLQNQSRTLSSAVATARESVLDSPLKMLSAQSNMLHAIVEVDLIAKTAGSLAQGVNKLVSMQ